MHRTPCLGDHIRCPIPTPRRLQHHLRYWPGLLNLETQRHRTVVDPVRPQLGSVCFEDHDHRTAPMQIHTHVTCHLRAPRLDCDDTPSSVLGHHERGGSRSSWHHFEDRLRSPRCVVDVVQRNAGSRRLRGARERSGGSSDLGGLCAAGAGVKMGPVFVRVRPPKLSQVLSRGSPPVAAARISSRARCDLLPVLGWVAGGAAGVGGRAYVVRGLTVAAH